MGFDKTVSACIFGVTAQASDVRLPLGFSTGGTHTSIANPLRGTLLWDDCMYVLTGVSVGGGATGGSYTLTIETDAVKGYTGLPIAQAANIGPLSPKVVVMDNLHKSKASPVPTHMDVNLTAGTSQIWFSCHVLAKQYRGTLGTAGANTAERILQGTMLRGTTKTLSGGVFSGAGDPGMSADTTFTLGTSGTALGMHRMRLWDTALFWAVAGATLAGTWDCDIIATVGGSTVSIATSGVGGALAAAGQQQALASNFYGQCPNPTHIIWTEVTAGGLSDSRVVMLAKGGRGSMAKS